jgi:5-methylthioadenosine/S-adenosylhomocysteine deaminase
MYHFYEDGVRAMIESGIRAAPGGVLLGFLPEPEKRIANAIAFAREYANAADGRIIPTLAPHSLYTCNRAQWKMMIEGAHELGILLTTHASETQREVANVRAEWGDSPVQTLKNIGALDGALLAAHCVHVDERDIEIMRENDMRVAHNPTSNLKLASGFAPVQKLIEAGITIGLGPDGTASNNKLDMWQEMRLAALLHKATTGDPTVVSAQQALLMATRDGARCLNLQHEIGTLETGKKADIVLLDFDKPHLTPRHNVVSHLVYAANASDVDTVLVDGQILLRHGQTTQVDTPQICSEAAACAARLTQKASVEGN